MKTAPAAAPSTSRPGPRLKPCQSRPTLAASMNPAAIAFDVPSHVLPMPFFGRKRNGIAPSPVASAVNSAATVTVQTLTGIGHTIGAARPRRIRTYAERATSRLPGARHPLRSWSADVIERIQVIGSGRAGSAIAARLRERGLAVGADAPELVLLCVPDSAIAEVAASVEPGPWVAHVSGATPLAALAPHARRFSVHPLQTFTLARGPEQLDGAWGAVCAETADARAAGFELAETLGLRPFELDDSARTLYHAGAVFVSNYLVTLHRAAAMLFESAGAPPEALEPLMRRTIENDFELTGPISRGDWTTVEAHRDAIRAARPELDDLYETLAGATLALAT